MATWAIGDVQGCRGALERLLHGIDFDARRDRVWFAGDLVNRGEDSLGTLRMIRDLGDRAVVVLGNHDLHLLAIACGVRSPSRKDTLDDVLAASDTGELLDWLRSRSLVHHDDALGCVLVHAGVVPGWSREQLVARARRVEQLLRAEDWRGSLQSMYGDSPDRWRDDLAHEDAVRVVINACTRLRIVADDGDRDNAMQLRFKGPRNEIPVGYQAWFDGPHDASWQGWRVLFGHWAALDGHTGHDWAQALDTGCVWGNRLTALRIEDGVRCSVPAQETVS